MTFFLALPAEIQDLILGFAVTEPHAISIDSLPLLPDRNSAARCPSQYLRDKQHRRSQPNDLHPAAQPPITRVCHTIRLRALPLFYRHNIFLLVIRHAGTAHQQYRACYQPSPSTKKSEMSTQIHQFDPSPRRPPPPQSLPTRFIRHIETSHILRQNLQRFQIRHIFRRVDFEVEFEVRRTVMTSSALPQPRPSGPLASDSEGALHRQRHPGYRITRVVPRSADGWVYGYVQRAKMWLLFYDDAGEYGGSFDAPGGERRGLWRRLADVKELVQYDWRRSEERDMEERKKLSLRS